MRFIPSACLICFSIKLISPSPGSSSLPTSWTVGLLWGRCVSAETPHLLLGPTCSVTPRAVSTSSSPLVSEAGGWGAPRKIPPHGWGSLRLPSMPTFNRESVSEQHASVVVLEVWALRKPTLTTVMASFRSPFSWATGMPAELVKLYFWVGL